jgi:hypothetical protein
MPRRTEQDHAPNRVRVFSANLLCDHAAKRKTGNVEPRQTDRPTECDACVRQRRDLRWRLAGRPADTRIVDKHDVMLLRNSVGYLGIPRRSRKCLGRLCRLSVGRKYRHRGQNAAACRFSKRLSPETGDFPATASVALRITSITTLNLLIALSLLHRRIAVPPKIPRAEVADLSICSLTTEYAA